MSRQAKNLFFIVILLRNELELLICTLLIVPNNGDIVLAKRLRCYEVNWFQGNIRFMGFG